MRNVFLFLRRVAGLFGLLFGGHRAWEARRALKKLDTARYASRIVSDGVLMNDIPSPSEAETLRMEFVARRLGEFGVSNVFPDEWGNILALFPAFGTRRDFVLLVAEVGDSNYSPLGNLVHLSGDRAKGQGFGERSLGAAALLVFAEFAQATGFHLDKNLLLLFTRSSTVDEREESFRHFLDGWSDRIACGVLVRGTGLGTVETQHIGSYRLSVSVTTEDRDPQSPDLPTSAAVKLGTIAAQLENLAQQLPGPAQVSIARMEAGLGFGHWATRGEMDIEITAEDDKVLESARAEVAKTIEGSAAGSKAKVETLVRLRRSTGDPQRNAPLVETLRKALAKILVKPETGSVSDKISLLNVRGIPAVTVGLTTEPKGCPDEVDLGPISSGFRQLLLVVEGASAAVGQREE